jgi:hypothetical protein
MWQVHLILRKPHLVLRWDCLQTPQGTASGSRLCPARGAWLSEMKAVCVTMHRLVTWVLSVDTCVHRMLLSVELSPWCYGPEVAANDVVLPHHWLGLRSWRQCRLGKWRVKWHRASACERKEHRREENVSCTRQWQVHNFGPTTMGSHPI